MYKSNHVSIVGPLLLVLLTLQHGFGQECSPPTTIDGTLNKLICDQPVFYTILPKTEESVLLDNVCLTYFPLPDDPNTAMLYISSVYCDGSNSIQSTIISSIGRGSFRSANPMSTMSYYVFGYAGCDTFLGYVCSDYGASSPPYVVGASSSCRPIGLSCLRKVEEIISNAGVPEQDMYILPMKLPNRCVTQQACILPPNPFYNSLGPSVGLY
ncbi:uncharacterized protein LOC128997129 isoform X2 [Macrosteles quadrilineatus]|uniref:uncharacterized protein LOC128997129 isoform X2 n=1 Tax=Macrosteles quadrilineatus TaxID=74068 RepID=UPI0023E28323|nr:uncharacterized protein LOC128997129 isoform X2 [Macrosteles quadrilineatus]